MTKLYDELASARASQSGPTDAELEASARWALDHPDVSTEYKRTIGALLRLLDAQRKRTLAAVRLASRYRS